MTTFDVALRTTSHGPWRTFSDPVAVFQALESDDVVGCLAAVQSAVEQGAYAAGFLTYEAASGLGHPAHRRRTGFLPLVSFGIYPVDHVTSVARPAPRETYRLGAWRPLMDPEAYTKAMARAAASGIGPLTCSVGLEAAFDGEPRALMADLDAVEGGRMSAFVDAGTHAIAAASPELLFRIDGSSIECGVVTGSEPRGLSAAADRRQAERLRESAADRGEHAAIAEGLTGDLVRLGAAAAGIDRHFDVERSSFRWQMASSLRARIARASLPDLVNALFPARSITGARRADAMALIREIESGPRGLHTGAIGYLSPRGRGLVSVVRRAIVIDRERRAAGLTIERTAGGGRAPGNGLDGCLAEAASLLSVRSVPSGDPRVMVSYATAPRPDFRLMETIGWRPGEGFARLDRHLARLAESAECFGFECDPAEVGRVLSAAVEDLAGAARVRVLVSRDGAITCEAVDLGAVGPRRLRAAFAAEPVASGDLYLYHQTTRRAVHDRARASRPDADAVLLWNERGELTEATEWNVVVEIDGRKVTPQADCGLLPGTLRAELLACGEIVEARVTRETVRGATRFWLINSVSGWVEAELISS